MARSRNIKPGFFRNETLADIDPLGRILFAGLWTIADRDGRLQDRPKRIKAEVLPYDDCDADQLLTDLHKHKFILRYESDGHQYIQVLAWDKHQNPHVNEVASTIPAPVLNSAEHESSTEKIGASPADSLLLIPDSSRKPSRPTRKRADVATSGKNPKLVYTAEDEALAKRMFEAVKLVAPSAKEPSYAAWANAIRLMREHDEHTHEQIWTVFEWANHDSFWRTNILSPGTLREKWTQLEAKMLAAAPPAKPQRSAVPDQWWKSDEGMRMKGEELKIPAPAAGASEWLTYRARVLVAAGDGPWLPDEREITLYNAVQQVRSRQSTPPRPS